MDALIASKEIDVLDVAVPLGAEIEQVAGAYMRIRCMDGDLHPCEYGGLFWKQDLYLHIAGEIS